MARHETLAAVDLGSNSFHLQIGRVVDGQIYPLDAVREVVRLGAGLTAEKRIDRATQAAALEALAKFAERLRGFPRQAVRAVGTNALRVAKNSAPFLREARGVLGFPIEVISGREEARLIYLGVAHALPAGPQKRLVIDVGGGSTEFTFGDGPVPRGRTSLQVGAVRLTERHVRGDPIPPEELARLHEAARAALAPLSAMDLHAGGRLVGVAGTVTTLSAVAQALPVYDAERVHGAALTLDEIEGLVGRLAALEVRARAALPGMEPKRADVIVAGAVVVAEAMRATGFDRLIVSDRGVRWGLLYDRL